MNNFLCNYSSEQQAKKNYSSHWYSNLIIKQSLKAFQKPLSVQIENRQLIKQVFIKKKIVITVFVSPLIKKVWKFPSFKIPSILIGERI